MFVFSREEVVSSSEGVVVIIKKLSTGLGESLAEMSLLIASSQVSKVIESHRSLAAFLCPAGGRSLRAGGKAAEAGEAGRASGAGGAGKARGSRPWDRLPPECFPTTPD